MAVELGGLSQGWGRGGHPGVRGAPAVMSCAVLGLSPFGM